MITDQLEKENKEFLECSSFEDFFSVRTSNILRSLEIKNLLELTRKTTKDLICVNSCGKKTIQEIRTVLSKRKLSLKDEICLSDQLIVQEILSIPKTMKDIQREIWEMLRRLKVLDSFLEEVISKTYREDV